MTSPEQRKDPPLDKYVSVTYIDSGINVARHDTWEQALIATETPYLKIPRRWCHGRRDRGHWTLVQIIGSPEVPHEVVNGRWSNGVLRPGPLAIIFMPHDVRCCEHHLSLSEREKATQVRSKLRKARSQLRKGQITQDQYTIEIEQLLRSGENE